MPAPEGPTVGPNHRHYPANPQIYIYYKPFLKNMPMKKNQFIATAVLLLAAGTANSAQIHSENAVPSPDRTAAIRLQSAPDSQPVYEPDKVDVKASFPGGEIKQMEFLTKNLKFPEEALKEKVAGKIVIQFIVETDGSLTHMEVSSPLHPACDTEALS